MIFIISDFLLADILRPSDLIVSRNTGIVYLCRLSD
uniref:Uncharacterized protein n=1 Tax=Schistosoma curassoni TaxID=6186 RepID=A0A183KNY1_9TREM